MTALEQSTLQILNEYVSKKGHDKCWYYPDLFNKLIELYGIKSVEPELPSREEFVEGCMKFQDEMYGFDTIKVE